MMNNIARFRAAIFLISCAGMISVGYAQSPANSLVVDDTGRVGVGTDTPSTSLHVLRGDGTAQVFVEETGISGAQDLFKLESTGAGRPRFAITNNFVPSTWAFEVPASDGFAIGKLGTGVFEFLMDAVGNLTIQGSLSQSSSAAVKQNIVAISPQTILDKVLELPVSEWSYQKDPAGVRHMGPMAEDFAASFGLGATNKGISSIDTSGVALAAIQALKAENDAAIRELKNEIDELKDLIQVLMSNGQVASAMN